MRIACLHIAFNDDIERVVARARPHEADGTLIDGQLWIGDKTCTFETIAFTEFCKLLALT